MRGLVAQAAFTGMRRGEILGLRWKDVDLANQRVYLTETKNGTLRVVTLNTLAVQVLQSLPKGNPGELVFPGVDAARLSVYTRRVFTSVERMRLSTRYGTRRQAGWSWKGWTCTR